MKFHESHSTQVYVMNSDGRTDMTKLTDAFRGLREKRL